jgi:hypothetical protein
MRFFELVDNLGVAHYRYDEECMLMYWWNEENTEWVLSWTFEYPHDGEQYAIDLNKEGCPLASWREVEEAYVG